MKTSPPVDAATLAKLKPVISDELRRRVVSGVLYVRPALRRVFRELFGKRTRREEMRFLLFAAPIARRISIELADANERIGESDVRVSDVREWLRWLDFFDPLCARMIDLHYFAGLSTRQTAAALKLPPGAVIRDLRFAKCWLQTKL